MFLQPILIYSQREHFLRRNFCRAGVTRVTARSSGRCTSSPGNFLATNVDRSCDDEVNCGQHRNMMVVWGYSRSACCQSSSAVTQQRMLNSQGSVLRRVRSHQSGLAEEGFQHRDAKVPFWNTQAVLETEITGLVQFIVRSVKPFVTNSRRHDGKIKIAIQYVS